MTDQFKERTMTMVFIMSIIWTLFAIGYITAVTFLNVPIGSTRIVDQVLGFIMGTVVAGVLQFWTGSSVGSKTKDNPKETNE